MKRSTVDIETVRTVARLARIKLTETEEQTLTAEIAAIVDHVASISALDVDGIEPTSHALGPGGPLRDDEPELGLQHEEALAGAPRTALGGFAVPKILDGDG